MLENVILFEFLAKITEILFDSLEEFLFVFAINLRKSIVLT